MASTALRGRLADAGVTPFAATLIDDPVIKPAPPPPPPRPRPPRPPGWCLLGNGAWPSYGVRPPDLDALDLMAEWRGRKKLEAELVDGLEQVNRILAADLGGVVADRNLDWLMKVLLDRRSDRANWQAALDHLRNPVRSEPPPPPPADTVAVLADVFARDTSPIRQRFEASRAAARARLADADRDLDTLRGIVGDDDDRYFVQTTPRGYWVQQLYDHGVSVASAAAGTGRRLGFGSPRLAFDARGPFDVCLDEVSWWLRIKREAEARLHDLDAVESLVEDTRVKMAAAAIDTQQGEAGTIEAVQVAQLQADVPEELVRVRKDLDQADVDIKTAKGIHDDLIRLGIVGGEPEKKALAAIERAEAQFHAARDAWVKATGSYATRIVQGAVTGENESIARLRRLVERFGDCFTDGQRFAGLLSQISFDEAAINTLAAAMAVK